MSQNLDVTFNWLQQDYYV